MERREEHIQYPDFETEFRDFGYTAARIPDGVSRECEYKRTAQVPHPCGNRAEWYILGGALPMSESGEYDCSDHALEKLNRIKELTGE